ncbi:sn-glycerol 3-phosphate ABC transporter ATP binding subunit [Rhodovastum atsumiense]|uniref:sn-glycerol-3-phosphate ABC transporter ATP-binding protein UgpC n=1 Tax=Rhodovastum atsumiense TaxID=504468 RepID=A0A5M6J0H6_9PROT|nr:sn-glycerol-3-phosphate ABC transporter ATP-binding protein UgpC [Rhodovastum atsumiense]KAA5614106.1 sn-glycerol-3-phosphate ABC transporter ATP-binding protein UgpC [Rhodovastum atsumiense]CAH2598948.1 sn-glycerol 3-phosphate ABC transporter ATP binding subunit [Rhodovastum atsumiense]
MGEVQLRAVAKRFGAQTVVHPMDLDVADGEFLVLVGPSGCGKSTTLRMIAGLEEVSGGEIRIAGRTVTDLEPKDRNIAMVFQNYALYPHMTVRENMGFGLQVARMPRAEIDRRVEEAAAILDLTPLLARRPAQLSGGQRQRVAMGRAMVRRPAVFLFDEPLSNLDAKLRNQVRTEIKKLHQALRTTIVYVTHDQVEAMTLADRVVVMRDGRIEQVGAPMEVYRHPANLFVGGFIGAPAMNQLPARVVAGRACVGEGLAFTLPGDVLEPKLVLGLRPEDIVPARPGEPDTFAAMLRVVEPLGAETLLLIEAGGHELTVRLAERGEPPRAGEWRYFRPLPGSLHLFHPDGRALGQA